MSAIILLSLGIFVYVKNPRIRANQFFTLYLFSCAIWQWAFALMNTVKNSDDAFLFSRIIYTAVIFIPLFYYEFITHFFSAANRRMARWIFYVLAIYFEYKLWFGLDFIRGNIQYSWGFSSRSGWLHNYFLIYFSIVFMCCFVEMWIAHKNTSNSETKNKIKYVFVAFCIAITASTDFLSTYGVDYYPLGFVFMIIFAAITTYAIIKHQLLSINFVIRKSVIYSISFVFISIVFSFVVLLMQSLSHYYLGHSSFRFVFFSMLMVSILFIPLHNFLNDKIGRMLFMATPEELLETNKKLILEIQRQNQMKAVGVLAAGMAHEIKNPLTAIRTFADYLPSKSQDPEFVDKFQKIIVQETERIKEIVMRLLVFSKPSKPKTRLVDINLIIQNVAELLSGQILKSGITITLTLTDQKKPINIDPDEIKQALLNIILNAIEAMAPGGGEIVIKSIDKDRELEILVQDSGPGISPEKLPHIFDLFYTDKVSGTGLGLAVTLSLIEKNNGKVRVISKPSEGAIFLISFPKSTKH